MKASFFGCIIWGLIVLFSIACSGCHGLVASTKSNIMSPTRPDDDETFAQNKKTYIDEFTAAQAEPTAAANRDNKMVAAREKLAGLYFTWYNRACQKFLSDFSGRSAAIMSGGKIASLGLTTAAAVTSPLATSQLLSGISAAVLGSTAVLNQEFLGNLGQLVIAQKVTQMTSAKYKDIVDKLAAEKGKVNTYWPSSMEADFQEYLNDCSVMAAVSGLSQGNSSSLPTYTVTSAKATDDGTITPASATANFGQVITFTITANDGKKVTDVVTTCPGNGHRADPVYTTPPITQNCTVTAVFGSK